MNSRERVLKTLNHEEPDKVPYWEHLIQCESLELRLKGIKHKKQIESGNDPGKLLDLVLRIKRAPQIANCFIKSFYNHPQFGRLASFMIKRGIKKRFDLYRKIKVDMTSIPVTQLNMRLKMDGKSLYTISQWGAMIDLTKGTYIDGYLKTKEDYYHHIKDLRYDYALGELTYRNMLKTNNQDDLLIIPGFYGGIFDHTWQGFGLSTFSRMLRKEKSFIKDVVKQKEVYYREIMKAFIDNFDVDAFFIGDDLAFNSGPFVSPRVFNEVFLPAYKRLSKMLHKRGVKLIFHSDGDIRPLLDGLIEVADMIHPWQLSANIDIAEIKQKYGDKITIAGNVPVADLIHESKQKISEYIKYLLKNCAPGGGYMLSSGNSIVRQIPWDKYLTMLSTFWKYRDYPIKL